MGSIEGPEKTGLKFEVYNTKPTCTRPRVSSSKYVISVVVFGVLQAFLRKALGLIAESCAPYCGRPSVDM